MGLLRDWVTYARSLSREGRSFTPLMAIAGLILIFAEEPIAWGLRRLSPDLGQTLDAMGRGMRVLLMGVPATLLFLAAVFVPDFRRKKAAGHLGHSKKEP